MLGGGGWWWCYLPPPPPPVDGGGLLVPKSPPYRTFCEEELITGLTSNCAHPHIHRRSPPRAGVWHKAMRHHRRSGSGKRQGRPSFGCVQHKLAAAGLPSWRRPHHGFSSGGDVERDLDGHIGAEALRPVRGEAPEPLRPWLLLPLHHGLARRFSPPPDRDGGLAHRVEEVPRWLLRCRRVAI